MTQDNRNQTTAAETPKFFIDKGVKLEGNLAFSGDERNVARIQGEFVGNINWNGRVVITEGASVQVLEEANCRELHVAGEIRAAESAKTTVGLLRIVPTGRVDVGALTLPVGGLEQQRGSVLNATLRMVQDHPFACEQPAAPALPAKPVLVAVAGEGTGDSGARGADAQPLSTGTAG